MKKVQCNGHFSAIDKGIANIWVAKEKFRESGSENSTFNRFNDSRDSKISYAELPSVGSKIQGIQRFNAVSSL